MNQSNVVLAVKTLGLSLLGKFPKAIFLWFLIGWAASYFGTFDWRLELASHFKLQYLGVSLAFGALFAVFKQWRWTAAALCCALASSPGVVSWYWPKTMSLQAENTRQIRLLLSNVFVSNARYDDFIALVKAEQPDLLFVQEVTSPWAKTLERLRSDYPHGIVRGTDDAGGIAALSRLPLVNADDAGIGEYNGPSLEIRLEINHRLLHIITSHTPPPMGKLNSARRNEHFNVIADRLRELPSPKLLIGDMNSTMWSPYFKELIARTELVNVREGFGVLPTWPTWLRPAMIPIDHCLVSRDLCVVNVRTGPHIGSDHLPVIVDLQVPGANEP